MSKFRLLNARKVEVVNFCQILNLMSLMIFIQKGFDLACNEQLKNYTDEPKIYFQHFFFFFFLSFGGFSEQRFPKERHHFAPN